jgi:hypothetical protein
VPTQEVLAPVNETLVHVRLLGRFEVEVDGHLTMLDYTLFINGCIAYIAT